jgi:transcription-repair coupling factor (superfamily II helicase)
VVEGLRQGTVDVVIGTHRLLSKDVQFKRLGLLIIDEEHRFGVAHKERMKQLRASVDALALTATPIPRTLYMALSGVRDMSVIETPPLDRLPIETWCGASARPSSGSAASASSSAAARCSSCTTACSRSPP